MTYQPYDPIPPAQQYPAYDPAQPSGPPASGGPYYSPPASGGPYAAPASGGPYYAPTAPLPVPYVQPLYQQPIVVPLTPPPASGAATASLVLGLIGIVAGFCLFGIPCVLAVIFGHVGLIQTRGGQKSGRG